MGQGLENVRSLYLEGIAQGNAREAVTRYTGHRYTQHSTGVADGVEGFLEFFEPFLERNPKRDISIVRSLEDGPWVWVSAFQSLNDGEAKWVTMDLFYTDPEGLVLEHWDTILAYEETASGHDMVGGPTGPDLSADTQANKELVLEFVKQVLTHGDLSKLDQFVAEDLIQRSPDIPGGREGLANWLGSDAGGSYEFLFKLVGQGDLVVTYGKRHVAGKDIAVFDLYRIAKGKIVEQWSNPEEIGPRENWGNSGKF
ncbi:MAG: nuclear transport factor 2 family protein [Pseudomonadota bacterium]|nr:nuclear transport factor 2 family protein [Pseudomonadota bacterium]